MIYEYEVELKLINKNTKDSRLIKRREHAYNIQDAMMQAVLNASADMDTSSSEFKLMRIGPPPEAVLDVADGVRKLVSTALGRISDGGAAIQPK